MFDVACLLNCNVWQNSGETEEESWDRQLKLLRNVISHYGEMEIFASITEDEIVESFLLIVRYGLKYSNLTGTGVYDFWARIFGLKYDKPQWNPALLIIEICMCAPISKASQMNIVKSNVRNRLTNSALMHFYASKFQKFPSILFIKITFRGVLNTGSKRKASEWRKETQTLPM